MFDGKEKNVNIKLKVEERNEASIQPGFENAVSGFTGATR